LRPTYEVDLGPACQPTGPAVRPGRGTHLPGQFGRTCEASPARVTSLLGWPVGGTCLSGPLDPLLGPIVRVGWWGSDDCWDIAVRLNLLIK
jgi:hypothetical protein